MTRTVDSGLPPLPESWQGQFRPYHTEQWRGWVANDYWFAGIEGNLQDPEAFFSAPKLQYWYKQGRNRLAAVCWPDSRDSVNLVVLKSYGTGGWHGQLRSFFRPSRGFRHWQQAATLQSRGIQTPKPVWLAISNDRPRRLYLAVEPAPAHVRVRELLRDIGPQSETVDFAGRPLAVSDLVTALAHYARDLHNAGVAHRDFSGGNILIPKTWDGNSEGLLQVFVLLDINRARLFAPGTVDIYHRIQDLERISLVESRQQEYYRAYAGPDPELRTQWPRYQRYRRGYLRMRKTSNPLWRFVLKISTYWIRSG